MKKETCETCETCKYSQLNIKNLSEEYQKQRKYQYMNINLCKRRAPTWREHDKCSAFPEVHLKTWCGEYRKRPRACKHRWRDLLSDRERLGPATMTFTVFVGLMILATITLPLFEVVCYLIFEWEYHD